MNKIEDWRSKSVLVRHTLGMAQGDEQWTRNHRLVGVPTHPRHKDVIDCAYAAYLKYCEKNKELLIQNPSWCVDVSQQVDRKAWGPDPRSFNKDSLVYCFAVDRVLTVEDCG